MFSTINFQTQYNDDIMMGLFHPENSIKSFDKIEKLIDCEIEYRHDDQITKVNIVYASAAN